MTVSLLAGGELLAPVTTDAAGVFSFDDVAAGRLIVLVIVIVIVLVSDPAAAHAPATIGGAASTVGAWAAAAEAWATSASVDAAGVLSREGGDEELQAEAVSQSSVNASRTSGNGSRRRCTTACSGSARRPRTRGAP